MSQSKKLYESGHVWDQDLQLGQKNVIQALTDFLPPDATTLLDVGCGDGKVTAALIQALGRPIVGLDFSEEALSRCNFSTVRGDATELPFEDKTFDVVLTTDTLEHLPNEIEEQAWNQLFRVAKDWVAVTVPFRENLQDAAIKCDGCGHIYHANWHMRAYDWRSLVAKAPKGWSVEAIVLTGEAWPQYHPLEREFRSKVLDEWANWVDAVCPRCGASGDNPKPPSDLSGSVVSMLGSAIYDDILSNPLVRQYSEVLCFFKADEHITEALKTPKDASFRRISLNQLDWQHTTRQINLVPFPEYPRLVSGEDGTIVAQFPVYAKPSSLFLSSSQDKEQSFTVIIEDGIGQVLSQEAAFGSYDKVKIEFSRPISSGYYGLLVRIPADARLSFLEIEEESPRSVWHFEKDDNVLYHREVIDGCPLYLQVAEPLTIDMQALRTPFSGLTQQALEDHSNLVDATLAKLLVARLEAIDATRTIESAGSPAAMVSAVWTELRQVRSEVKAVLRTQQVLNKKVDAVETVHLRDLSQKIQALALRSDSSEQNVVLEVEEGTGGETLDVPLVTECSEVTEVEQLPPVVQSEYDIIDGRPRVVMLCHDQHLDRRVLAQAQSLISNGCKVTLFALSYTAEGGEEITPEGIRLIRIGLSQIVPENPTYKAYVKRQNRLNSILNFCCNGFGFASFAWRRLIGVAHRANWISYRAFLWLRYRNRHLADPLPFRSAFEAAACVVEADVLQVHDLPALEAGVNLAAEKGIPLVYDAHELYPEQRSFSKVQRRICSSEEARLIKHADLVFAVNESIGLEMAKRYGIPQPITVLNALDCEPDFDRSHGYNLLREKAGLGTERRILLFQGGFSPNRNLENLILAMSLIKNKDVDLIMLGFGEFGVLLQKKAAKLGLLDRRVYFLEAVPPQELIQHSASADIGIIPYPHADLNSYYCTPNKLFEFMQAGLPILANDSPELRRFVQDTSFGMVRKMHTARDIAAAIDEAFASEELTNWRSSLDAKCDGYTWSVQSSAYTDAMMLLLDTQPEMVKG